MTDATLRRRPAQSGHGHAPAHTDQTQANDHSILPVTRLEHGIPRTVGVFDLRGAAAAATARALRRGRPQVGHVSMGPGGWVSVRGQRSLPRGVHIAAQTSSKRPWWARLLRAQPTVQPVVAPRRLSWHR